jgi:hypothetical protein
LIKQWLPPPDKALECTKPTRFKPAREIFVPKNSWAVPLLERGGYVFFTRKHSPADLKDFESKD